MRKRGLILAALLLLLLTAMGTKGMLLTLPDAQPAAAGEFDTPRAMSRLQRILGDQRPHPIDSANGDAVRGRLVAEVRALGLTPTVTDDFVCNGVATSRGVSCGRVRNVLVTLGPAAGRHVLLVSHHDSTPTGPGAADDGIGMAVMLETAALLRNRPLQRPVTLLFDDGEESGLLGARAFLERNPLAARVDTLLNFESRGTSGPATMFETDQPNGAAIAAFSRAAERPVANSLTTDFSRLIPNTTDVAVLKEAKWTTLNFAIIGNENLYHSPGDTIANLDPRSVRHMGAQALALTAELASGPVAKVNGETLYADILGRGFVTLPRLVTFVALGILLLGFLLIAWKRRPGIGRASAGIGAALVASGLVAFIAHSLVLLLRPGEFWRAYPWATALAIDATAIAVSLAALLWVAPRIPRSRLRAAFWLIFLIFGAALCFAAPGAAIFFLVPPCVAGAGMLLERRLPGGERIAALIAAALLFLSWTPIMHLAEVLLDFDAGWIFAPIGALIVLPLLIELLPLATSTSRRPALALLAIGALAWLLPTLTPAYSAERPQRFAIEYGWDAQARTGRWYVAHDGARLPEAFTAAAGGTFEKGVKVPWWSRAGRWAAPAPAVPLPLPSLDQVSSAMTPQGRRVSYVLRSAGAEKVVIRAEGEAAFRQVRAAGSARTFGKGKEKDEFVLRCEGRSCDGMRFDLLLGSAAPVEAILYGTWSGLPPAAARLVAARPIPSTPQYNPDTTVSVTKIRL
jgi:hypothetical protein